MLYSLLTVAVLFATVLPTGSESAERYFKALKITCSKHGREVNGACICEDDYVGTHCQYKMQCSSYDRHLNGSCIECLEGFAGDRCEHILCLHGAQKAEDQECVCEKPYGGRFCDQLDTKDVYLFYNSKMLIIGPLGIIALIPLVAIYYGCEYMARKRQVKRVTKTLDINNIVVKSEAVRKLLLRDV
uniref:EGF-like domain-containing protein n=1 Tax=Steinernema glaseri TaxID=37863 RepID=A0A1I8ASJ4_9BILA